MTTTQTVAEVRRRAPGAKAPVAMKTLNRVNIYSLDRALYVASCFAASAPDHVVTIARCAAAESYSVLDGRIDKAALALRGLVSVYVLERASDV